MVFLKMDITNMSGIFPWPTWSDTRGSYWTFWWSWMVMISEKMKDVHNTLRILCTELTKSFIIPENLFGLKQKLYCFMFNLCCQQLQSLNFVQQNLFCFTAAKRYVQDAPPGQSSWQSSQWPSCTPLSGWLWWLLWWLPWGQGWSWGCAHTPCPWGSSTDRNLGGLGLVSAVTTSGCTWGWQIQVCLQRRGAHLEHIFEQL